MGVTSQLIRAVTTRGSKTSFKEDGAKNQLFLPKTISSPPFQSAKQFIAAL